jgi:basic membrane lipoprotein Med (substrate-binding protein (PBP1-ABC) superfamily)
MKKILEKAFYDQFLGDKSFFIQEYDLIQKIKKELKNRNLLERILNKDLK